MFKYRDVIFVTDHNIFVCLFVFILFLFFVLFFNQFTGFAWRVCETFSFFQLYIEAETVAYWICSEVTDATKHASGRWLDNCDNITTYPDESRISALVGQQLELTYDASGRTVVTAPSSLVAIQGTCSEFRYHPLFASCAKGRLPQKDCE